MVGDGDNRSGVDRADDGEDGPGSTVRRWPLYVLAAIAGGLLLAWIVPPRFVDYGGGDPENYLANGVRQATQPEPAYEFLPEEWRDLDPADRRLLRRALLDGESRMFRLLDLPPDAGDAEDPVIDPGIARKKATVDGDDRIRIAHDNLYATVLGGAVLLDDRLLPYLLNYLLLVGCGAVLGLIVRRVTDSTPIAVAVGVLLVALPSFVEAARVTRTENFATLLFLAFAWLTMRDRAATAWPGLLLVALWATRHEFIVPVLLYLGWAALRRKRGGGVVVGATVAAAYLLAWGLASPGDLFPDTRDVFSSLPSVPAWVIVPVFAAAWWLGGRERARLDGVAAAVTRLGRRHSIHRLAWAGLIAVAVVGELVRRDLAVGERTLGLFRGQRLSTLGVIVDSAGWPLAVLGAVGLVWAGWRLAGRVPLIVAVVTLPQAYVLVRMGASGADLWAWSRRLHVALYPVLLLGLSLLLAEIGRRLSARSTDAAPRLPAATGPVVLVLVLLVVGVGLLVPHDRRPAGDAPTRVDVDDFHDAVDDLAPDSAVLLAPAYGSMKSQLPMRVFGDRWSFVVWDEAAAAEVLPAALACLRRPLYVEADLVDLAAAAGAEVDADPRAVPANYNEGPGRTLELHAAGPPADRAAC